ncbi:MAG: calcium:proton antiporter [Chthoniobacterales bacterium]
MTESRAAAWAKEWGLLLNFGTAAVFFTWGNVLLSGLEQPAWFGVIVVWLLGSVLLASFSVMRHADALAVKLGEPYGTLLLTLAVTSIEVMMIAAATAGKGAGSPLARDAMFAVVMIVLNGMLGLALLLGGLRYREQTYNLQGASSYLSMIISLSVLGLILPNFIGPALDPTFSHAQAIFVSIMSLGIYGIFLAVQTRLHRHYFLSPAAENDAEADDAHHDVVVRSIPFHLGLLLGYLLPLVLLAKKLAVPIDYGIHVLHAPEALGGFIIAALVLSPESISAFRAALSNRLQRSVNLLLGSVLATIGLTIPAVLTIGLFTGRSVVLGLQPAEIVLLMLTLVISIVTFTSRRTNILLGAVHLLLFIAYLMLIFDGV